MRVVHEGMNVIVLGARVIGVELARDIVGGFLGAESSGAPRHVRRLNKVKAIERRYLA
jgi:ribose 5-phosphate isomerase RpiB